MSVLTKIWSLAFSFYLPMDYSTVRLSRISLGINKDKHFSCDLRRSNVNFMLSWGRIPSEPLAILHLGPGSILTYFHHTR